MPIIWKHTHFVGYELRRDCPGCRVPHLPGPGGRDFLQAYNCQAVVDHAHQVIVAARATNQSSDKQQAAAMMQETIDNVGAVPREVSADAGYYSQRQSTTSRPWAWTHYRGSRHGKGSAGAPRSHTQAPVPQGPDRRKLQTRRGRQRYAAAVDRSARSRRAGAPAVLMRGLDKVQGEWSLITGHNLPCSTAVDRPPDQHEPPGNRARGMPAHRLERSHAQASQSEHRQPAGIIDADRSLPGETSTEVAIPGDAIWFWRPGCRQLMVALRRCAGPHRR